MERPFPGELIFSKPLLTSFKLTIHVNSQDTCSNTYIVRAIYSVQVLFRIFDNMKLKENGDDSDFPDRSLPSVLNMTNL